jgi:hypothetical protein
VQTISKGFLSRFAGFGRSRSGSLGSRRRFRPVLDQVEERVVMSTFTISNAYSGKYLDTHGATNNGASVSEYPYTGGLTQEWNLNKLSDGNYNIISASSGLYLSEQMIMTTKGPTTTPDTTAGTSIVQSASNGAMYQQWQFVPKSGGNYNIVNAYSGECLDIPAGNYAGVMQYKNDGAVTQQWTLHLTGTAPNTTGLVTSGTVATVTNVPAPSPPPVGPAPASTPDPGYTSAPAIPSWFTISAMGGPWLDGQTAKFSVSLPQAYSKPITVNYSTTPISAIAGTDYTPESGTLTFPAGAQFETISVPTLLDNGFYIGSTRTFALNLYGGTAGGGSVVTVATPRVVMTLDGVVIPPLPTISIQNAPAVGDGQIARFTATLSHAFNTPIAVMFTTVNNGSAIAGQDYIPRSALLEIPAGTLTATFLVQTLPDFCLYQGSSRVLEAKVSYAYPVYSSTQVNDLTVTNSTATAMIEGVYTHSSFYPGYFYPSYCGLYDYLYYW